MPQPAQSTRATAPPTRPTISATDVPEPRVRRGRSSSSTFKRGGAGAAVLLQRASPCAAARAAGSG